MFWASRLLQRVASAESLKEVSLKIKSMRGTACGGAAVGAGYISRVIPSLSSPGLDAAARGLKRLP